MGKKETYEAKVEAFLLPLMEEHGFELVEMKAIFWRSALRALADR